jgi:hypothetical protein
MVKKILSKTTKVSALRCSKCGDVVFSRAGHDFRSCTCGSLSVDGGRNYMRIAFDPKFIAGLDSLVKMELELPINEQELYKDWNYSVDKWGKHNYYDIEKYVKVLVKPEIKSNEDKN